MGKTILIPLHRKYLRTCNSCGYQWHVGWRAVLGFTGKRASDARKSIRVGRNMGWQQGSYYAALDVAQRDADRSGLEALDVAMHTCAKCGISDYSQRPWRKSDAAGP